MLVDTVMIRFSVFSNERAKSEIESFGFRCTMLETSSRRMMRTVAVSIRREDELRRVEDFVNVLSREYCVYIILHEQEQRDDDEIVSSPTGRYLSGKENEFIAHVVNDDVVKKTCHDLGISRSGYYKTLKRILGKLDLESAEQLRSWALLHLSV